MKKQNQIPSTNFVSSLIGRSAPTNSIVPIGDAIHEFKMAKSSTSKRKHLRSLEGVLRKLKTVTGNIPITSITAAQVGRIIFDPFLHRRTQQFYLATIRSFLKWCRSQGYLPIDRPTVSDHLIVNVPVFVRQVLTPDELRRLLTVATDPEVVLAIAFQAFLGIRRMELETLTWQNVIPGFAVHVNAWKSGGIRREIPILPALDAWLRPFYGREGSVISSKSFHQKIRCLAKGIGIELKPNVFRNSYGAYRLADTKDFLRTALEMGYNADRSWNPFVDALSSQAHQYFALTPEAVGITDWNQRVARRLKSRGKESARKPLARNHDTGGQTKKESAGA